MQTEQLEKQNWMSLSGKILEGGFELKDLIEADDSRALFRARVLGDREMVATALFRRLDAASADRQVELWKSVREFRDPHLNSPLGCGTAELNGSRTAYVVIRQPDESLGGVVRERALNPAEMKEAILNVAKGLEVLHLNGLVHGNVAPDQIVAIGDSIRLSGEGVRAIGVAPAFELKPASYLAPESKGTNLTPESDIWCLGATVFQSLTQKPWAEGEREKADVLPEPFAAIALRCLTAEPGERCRLAEVVALARGEIKPAPRPKAVPAPVAAAATVLPINEKEIHASGLNGKSPATPLAEPKPEGAAEPARTPESKTASPAPPTAAASTPAPTASAPNGTTRRDPGAAGKPTAENRVESRVPDRKPTPIASTQPIPKVKPINEGPAPTPFPAKPIREDVSPGRDKFIVDERSSKIWIWAGVAVLAVLFLVWALRPKHSAPAASGPAVSTTGSSTAQTRAGGNAWETKTIQPDGTASSTSSAGTEAKAPSSAATHSATASKPTDRSHTQSSPAAAVKEAAKKPETGSASGAVWRTVLFTYNRQADADARAKALNAQHANLHAEVFSPSGSGPYLVCAGGRMSKEDANQMRRRAVSLGLPHDSYIQNFKH